MHKTTRKPVSGRRSPGFVRIAVADDTDTARQYADLLRKHSILAMVRRRKNAGLFAVWLYVREDKYDTAYALIESVNGLDGLLDATFLAEHGQPKAG